MTREVTTTGHQTEHSRPMEISLKTGDTVLSRGQALRGRGAKVLGVRKGHVELENVKGVFILSKPEVRMERQTKTVLVSFYSSMSISWN